MLGKINLTLPTLEIFYNRQRRHSRLGNISPAAFREKYHQMAA
ncbi:putative IS600 orfB family domain protein [Escherichia coli 5-366-08_S4_C1]|uniref:Integrase catalytic domain-containing protein n=1 Tax=Escherichia coli TaxID=562 RepID=A0A9P1K273_ECOLX|nr:hypothetical protein FORC29_p063 [Escherichia coli]KDX01227.1 putative IS600 orfB family domain protein [Escherichia coli 2-177-06_S4_C3]KEO30057.1 putative IS600 orfB family domain protein [Escherichia coli 5-366-08_S4_C1]ATI10910.1 hypothetical protein FORC43_p077 [Escherichia coli]AXV27946.1 hypothetical protein FORC69_p097 [Escherichia coli]